MKTLLLFPTHKKTYFFLVLLLGIGFTGGVYCFSISYLYHSNVIAGALLFPFALFVDGKRRNNYAYAALIVFLSTVAWIYHIRIAYFFMLAMFTLWLIEYFVGRCNSVVLFLIAAMLPFFMQVTTILGFPLRLQLSNIAGIILRTMGLNVVMEGNLLVLDGSLFSVDDACIGLNMLAMTMLMGVFLIAYQYKLTGRRLSFFQLSFFFLVGFGLNLLTNLIRIVVLVLFKIPPESYMHEMIGLTCFAVYTLIPLYFFSEWLIMKGRTPNSEIQASPQKLSLHKKILLVIFALFILATGISVNEEKLRLANHRIDVLYPEGKKEILHDGVVKVETNKLLIYVKPIAEFFSGEHTPLICWKGSGYSFHGIKELEIGDKKIYVGKLTRHDEELYTAWWYSNGLVQTISQLEWRTQMLKGSRRYSLINVTSTDEQSLLREVSSILHENKLRLKQQF